MTQNEIEIEIIDIFCDFFKDYTLLLDSSSLLPEMDSLSFIELVVNIETRFDIELYDEELIYDSSMTIQKWATIIEKHLNHDCTNAMCTDNYLLME